MLSYAISRVVCYSVFKKSCEKKSWNLPKYSVIFRQRQCVRNAWNIDKYKDTYKIFYGKNVEKIACWGFVGVSSF